MNRLFIIGNGFDLAHGLPTSYKHFIDDYWRGIFVRNGQKKIKREDLLIDLICEFEGIYNNSEYDLIDRIKTYNELKSFIERNKNRGYGVFNIEFKNSFFENICNKSIENWVDIEAEYYRELKKIVKLSINSDKKKERVKVLNDEFEEIKNLLSRYLGEKVDEAYDFVLKDDYPILQFLLPELMPSFSEDEFLKEFKYNDQSYVKKFLKEGIKNYTVETFFLSFNYTKLAEAYSDGVAYSKKLNYIHGKLCNPDNLINFGFGDEMDDDYKVIENLDDNEYLRNFKSFQYSQNSNYKKLLDYIESDKFQVYIMGHSCGLSDRTMLNTIFEHPNCISIKVFYYERKDENGKVINDNYTEIIQNISRHFNKKGLMREKIVNKTLCKPMPQIQLPLKK